MNTKNLISGETTEIVENGNDISIEVNYLPDNIGNVLDRQSNDYKQTRIMSQTEFDNFTGDKDNTFFFLW